MPVKQIRVVAAVVQKDGLYLITQRRDEAVLGGLWEFPGGKVEAAETDAAALRRELHERIGVDASIGDKLGERLTVYTDYEVTLVLYAATLGDTAPAPLRVKDVRWVASTDFDRYPFPAADQKTMDALLDIRR